MSAGGSRQNPTVCSATDSGYELRFRTAITEVARQGVKTGLLPTSTF
jgi:hypothetical protein